MAARTKGEIVGTALLVLMALALGYFLLVPFAHYAALLFCGVLLAVALDGLARFINVRGKLPHWLALAGVMLLLAGAGAGLAIWIGPQLVDQFEQLKKEVPRGLAAARDWLMSTELGRRMLQEAPGLDRMAPSAQGLLQNTGRFFGAGLSAIADVLIVVVLAVFLAVSPGQYQRGLTALLPQRQRQRARDVMQHMGVALRRWLVTRTLLMLLLSVLFGVGLFILGVPLALPLALLAGLFNFVPYVGPVLAYIPAAAMGLLVSPAHALYVTILYLAAQVVESYIVEPAVEAKALSLAPALIILAQLICAVWLGAIGVLIATPLLVVTVVAVQMLYVRDVLHDDVEVIGAQHDSA